VRAWTRTLPPGARIDALALAGESGVYFADDELMLAGCGRAALLPLPEGLAGWRSVEAWLRGVEVDDDLRRPGTGPVAFGALPFERDAPSAMVVPSVLYGRAADGTEWVTAVGEGPRPALTREWLAEQGPGPIPIEFAVTPELVDCEPEDYPAAVRRATEAIRGGSLRKVVLARRLIVETGSPVVAPAMLARLTDDEPSCTAFLVGGPQSTFLGASPELLVSRRDRGVLSHPLAGTVALDGSGAEERGRRLLASEKNLEEHELVVADIARVLDPLCSELIVPSDPSLVPLRTMAHLGTRIEGRLLEEDGRVPGALELVAALHPTPAVGGVPRADALALIAELEPGPRGQWAGPVGWVDANGDGDFVVGLRSAILDGSTATIWAGAGIVGASDPDAELAETAVKLTPVLEGLFPGSSALLGHCSVRN
jgi:menaquinone-specific isochorismate synthase